MQLPELEPQKRHSKLSNVKKVTLILAVLVIALIIAGVFTLNPQLLTKLPINNNSASQTPPQASLPPLSEPAFDVPSLVGKDIDAIQEQIGPSVDKEPEDLPKETSTWRLTFRKGKVELVVTYGLKTKQALNFSLATDDPLGKTTDKARLLKLGTLQEGNNRYDVVFVKTAEDPNYFTAIKVLPK